MIIRIQKIFQDEEGEWLEVRYAGQRIKQTQRHCGDIRQSTKQTEELKLAIIEERNKTNNEEFYDRGIII